MNPSQIFYGCANSEGIRCKAKKHDVGTSGYSMLAHCGSCMLYKKRS